MEKIKIGDVCDILNGYAFKSENYVDSGIRIIRISNVQKGYIEDSTPAFYSFDTMGLSKFMLEEGDLLMSLTGNVGRVAILEKELLPAALNQRVACLRLKSNKIAKSYLFHFLNSNFFEQQCIMASNGVAQKNMSTEWLKDYEIPLYTPNQQEEIVTVLNAAQSILSSRRQQLQKLDELVKARFVELFGDLKSNSKHWQVASFTDCAIIDTKMIHDFCGYEDYPHIGIDSIEKGTGRLYGYKTVAEDAVISGKYIFTPAHIIYSKIRPNLNKVALPDFTGLCSADAYPILVKSDVCNREFLGYTMRSSYFLDYILAFSGRTNLPKVNKNQVEGFTLPLPPIELQNQFSAFVTQTDKSKAVIQKALDEAQLLFDSLMQKYFG